MIRRLIFNMFVVGAEDANATGYPRIHELLKYRGVDVSYDDFIRLWFNVVDELDRWSARTGREYPMWRVASEFLAVFDADHTSVEHGWRKPHPSIFLPDPAVTRRHGEQTRAGNPPPAVTADEIQCSPRTRRWIEEDRT